MKVLFWVSIFPTVSETFIRNQIIDVLEKGIDVAIVTKSKNEDTQALQGFEKYNLLNLTTSFKEIIPKNKFKKLLKLVQVLFFSIFNNKLIYYVRLIKLIYSESNRRNIKSLFILNFILESKIDVIHCHFGPNGNDAIFLKKIGLPLKIICTFHGFDIRLALESKKNIYKELFKYVDTIISISKYNREKLLLLGASNNKIVDVNNGVQVNSFSNAVINKNKILKILSVGRLVEDKGYAVALHAIEKFKVSNPYVNFQYDIVGGGKLKNELIQLSKNLNIDSFVTFHGSQNSDFVKTKMMQCDFLFLPSKNEALPTVILEAQSLALPVLATNVGSIKDIVVDHITGFTVNYEEADLHIGLEKMFANQNNWKNFGENAKNNILKNYNRDKIVDGLLKIYSL
jgi:colanic acid/amylovoran biosynthesis glycosyltransferase